MEGSPVIRYQYHSHNIKIQNSKKKTNINDFENVVEAISSWERRPAEQCEVSPVEGCLED